MLTTMKTNQLYRILLAVDKLGNALSGGDHNVTISARLGYMTHHRDMWWAHFVAMIVDLSFFPVEGKGHCLNAWRNITLGTGELVDIRRGSDVGLTIMSLFVLAACPIILAFTLPAGVLKRIR